MAGYLRKEVEKTGNVYGWRKVDSGIFRSSPNIKINARGSRVQYVKNIGENKTREKCRCLFIGSCAEEAFPKLTLKAS